MKCFIVLLTCLYYIGNEAVTAEVKVDKDIFIESGKDFCWRTSYGRGVGVVPKRCPDGYPDKCGLANARQQCCEPCPRGYRRMKWPNLNTCKKEKSRHRVVTKKTNALCPIHKPDLATGLCYKACDEGFESDGVAMCWSKPPDLDYGWIKCGLGAARNANACVQQISAAVLGALETGLFLLSFGTSSAGTTAAKLPKDTPDEADDALKAWSEMSKREKFSEILNYDPTVGGKRLAMAMGRAEEVSDKSENILKLQKKVQDFLAGVYDWGGKVTKGIDAVAYMNDKATALEKSLPSVQDEDRHVVQEIKKIGKHLKRFFYMLKDFFLRVYNYFFESRKMKGSMPKPDKLSSFLSDLGGKASTVFKKYLDEAAEMARKYDDEVFSSVGANRHAFINSNLNDIRKKLKPIKDNIDKALDTSNKATTPENPLHFVPDEDVNVMIEKHDIELQQLTKHQAREIAKGLCFLFPDKHTSMALAYAYGDLDILYEMQDVVLKTEVSDEEIVEESYPNNKELKKAKNIDDLDDYFELTAEGRKYVSRMEKLWRKYIGSWNKEATKEAKNKWALDRYKDAIRVLRKSGKVEDSILEQAESLQTTTSPVDQMRTVLSTISMLDPTGIASNMAAYMYPNCCTYFMTADYDACKRLKNYSKKKERQEKRLAEKEKRAKKKQGRKAEKEEEKAERQQARIDKRIDILTKKGKIDKIKRIRKRKKEIANRKADKATEKLKKELEDSDKKEKRHKKKIEKKTVRSDNKAKRKLERLKKRDAKQNRVQTRKDENTVTKQERLDAKFNEVNTKEKIKKRRKHLRRKKKKKRRRKKKHN
eukprot:g4021.t1